MDAMDIPAPLDYPEQIVGACEVLHAAAIVLAEVAADEQNDCDALLRMLAHPTLDDMWRRALGATWADCAIMFASRVVGWV